MKRSKRLFRIADHVDQDQERAARELAQLRTQVRLQEDRLRQLREYGLAYREQLVEAQARGGSAARLLNYSQFLARLGEALSQQEQAVSAANRAFERQRQVWIQARSRVKAVSKAAERIALEEARQADRVEQKQHDDLSLNRLFKRS